MNDKAREEAYSDFYLVGYYEGFAEGVMLAVCIIGAVSLLWWFLS